MLANVTNF